MPSNQAVWGIEIGQCALKAIRLAHDPVTDQVEALAFDYIEHPKILSQPDADPDALSREAIQTFLSRNTVKGDRVVIGVPGQSGLARFIKLPPVEPARIPEIVKYEARQQIPFALEEVVWDFQTIGRSEETGGFALETEIGLFAMKRDLIYRFMNTFREAGVEVDIVQMRPLAVYNFAAFDQLGPHSAAAGEQESESAEAEGAERPAAEEGGFVVLLDMGADNSDLVITDGIRIWQRNLPIGGNHFTRALTKELKLTFAKAEHLKRNATKAQDPRAIFQAMRPVFNDLVSEIQRSIGYFSSVHRQSKISKIIGMGNAFKLPGLQKFLAQNLQYEVEKVESFKKLKGDQVLSAPAFQENILSFSVTYGLALQGLGVAGVRTSLLPPEISQARMVRRKKPWALSAAAILMAAFTFLFFGNWRQLHAVNSPAFSEPKTSAKNAQDLKSKKEQAYQDIKKKWEEVKSQGETLTANVDRRLEWIKVLEVINRALPRNPANVDLKNLQELNEVQITSITAVWLDDVKAGWFDGLVAKPNEWPSITAHPLDKKQPPQGPGWLFTLDGYHFNKLGREFTSYTLFDTPNGFQQASVREHGIHGALLIDNITHQWIPGTESTRTARSTRRSTVGGTASANTQMGQMGGMMGGMMGGAGQVRSGVAGFGARGDDESSPDRSRLDAAADGRSITSLGGRTEKETTKAAPGSVPITHLPRTDFVLEFVWLPEKAKDKTAEQWATELQQAGRPNRQIPEEVLKKLDQPAQTPPGGPGGSAAPGSPATQPPSAPQPNPNLPPGSSPAPSGPGVQGGAAPGATPGQPAGSQPGPNQLPSGTGATQGQNPPR